MTWILLILFLCFVFFFSSRRRHTRLQGDWSSDVCSSDLTRFLRTSALLETAGVPVPRVLASSCDKGWMLVEDLGPETLAERSEERRVGKECSEWGAPFE